MKCALIVNPNASAVTRYARFLDDFVQRINCDKLHSCRTQPIGALIREAARNYDRIVIAGGDGTLSESVNALAPDFDAAELAILPLGTGNDFARSIGLEADNLDAAGSIAASDNVRRIDLIKITNGTTRYCINAASGGFGGKISGDIDRYDKARWGAFAYWMTAVTKLIDLREYDVSLQLDGLTLETNVYGISIVNGRYVGGGFPISPFAVVNDGLLDVTTVPVLPTMELMAAGLNFTLGRHHRDDRVRTYRARRVKILADPNMPFSIDGEPLQTVEATFEVIPQALRIVVGHRPIGLGFDQPLAGQNVA